MSVVPHTDYPVLVTDRLLGQGGPVFQMIAHPTRPTVVGTGSIFDVAECLKLLAQVPGPEI